MYKTVAEQEGRHFNTDRITSKELLEMIGRLRRSKNPRTDEKPMEFYLELDEAALEMMLGISNGWWEKGDISSEELEARVVQIFKKGSIYKTKAAILQKRLEQGLGCQGLEVAAATACDPA